MLSCFRAANSIKKLILSLWYSKEPVVSQVSQFRPITGTLPQILWTTIVPNNVFAISRIRSVSIDEDLVKYKIWSAGEELRTLTERERYNILHDKVIEPWLWFGANNSRGTVDLTSDMNMFLVSGNKITLELLHDMHPGLSNWRYLDPVTFKEVDFPNSGITINAPRMENIEEEVKEDSNPE